MRVLSALTLDDFRPQARALLLGGVAPSMVTWQEESLFAPQPLPTVQGELRVPAAYGKLAATVSCHASPQRWSLLYAALWRLHHGEPRLLRDPADPLVRALETMAKQVGRDIHKAHAFVRFRKTTLEDGSDAYLAWHRPDHRILTLAAPFFVKRFRGQKWGIATPDESCCWDGAALRWGGGLPQTVLPPDDAVEDLWRTYYRNIFNPARIKTGMMKREMPVRYWATLPETQDIAAMLNEAPRRVETMLDTAFFSSEKSRARAARVRKRLA